MDGVAEAVVAVGMVLWAAHLRARGELQADVTAGCLEKLSGDEGDEVGGPERCSIR